MIFNLNGGGGSTDIVNGVIEEYLAESEDISANTFVEFVDSLNNEVTSNLNVWSTLRYSSGMDAVCLTDSKVFIMWEGSTESGSTTKRIQYMIVDITDTSIIMTHTEYMYFNRTTTNDIGIKLIRLSDNTVLAVRGGDGYTLIASTILISGTSIIIKNNIQVANTEWCGMLGYFNITQIGNQIAIVYCSSSTTYTLVLLDIVDYIITIENTLTVSATSYNYSYRLVNVDDCNLIISRGGGNISLFSYSYDNINKKSDIKFINDTIIFNSSNFSGNGIKSGYQINIPIISCNNKVSDYEVLYISTGATGKYSQSLYRFDMVVTNNVLTIQSMNIVRSQIYNFDNYYVLTECGNHSLYMLSYYDGHNNVTQNYYGFKSIGNKLGSINFNDIQLIDSNHSMCPWLAVGNENGITYFVIMDGTIYAHHFNITTKVIKAQNNVEGITRSTCTTTEKGKIYLLK